MYDITGDDYRLQLPTRWYPITHCHRPRNQPKIIMIASLLIGLPTLPTSPDLNSCVLFHTEGSREEYASGKSIRQHRDAKKGHFLRLGELPSGTYR